MNNQIFDDDTGTIEVQADIDMTNGDLEDVNDIWLDELNAQGSEIIQQDTIITNPSGVIYAPAADYPNAGIIGASNKRFNALYAQTVFEGDQVFMEKICPLCDEEFKEGEAIINYVLSNTEEGTRTIPAHMTCISKSENQTKAKYDLVIQKLKDTKRYIDPIKEIAKMEEIKIKLEMNMEERIKSKEVKMEKITLEDGKKGILVSKKGHFRVFSEEELIKLEKRCLDRLADIQKYLNELNK